MIDIRIHNDRPGGFTVAELMIASVLCGLILAFGISGFKAFQHQVRTRAAIRIVTSAFSTARYRAIELNRSVKVSSADNRLVLARKEDGEWQPLQDFRLPSGQAVTLNAFPVFFPTGYASPLCTAVVSNSRDQYKITLSIAGRIKVTKVI